MLGRQHPRPQPRVEQRERPANARLEYQLPSVQPHPKLSLPEPVCVSYRDV